MAGRSQYVRDVKTNEIQVKGPWHDEHGDRYVPCDPPDLRRGARPSVVSTNVEGDDDAQRKERPSNGRQKDGQDTKLAGEGSGKPAQGDEEKDSSHSTQPVGDDHGQEIKRQSLRENEGRVEDGREAGQKADGRKESAAVRQEKGKKEVTAIPKFKAPSAVKAPNVTQRRSTRSSKGTK